ncbi:MAG: HAD family hydrolase [Pseudomonadota bacterium]
MSYSDTLSTAAAFARYEALRHRMPVADFPEHSKPCSGLLELADQYDAFLLDSFGVLNIGERAIPGAAECLAELRRQGKRLIVLTNAASYTRTAAVERYRRLGFDFAQEEVVSSREVAAHRLEMVSPNARWGAIAASEDRFRDIDADVRHWDGHTDVDGFILLSSAEIDGATVSALETALRKKPRPVVVANPDLVAPRETGLSKEPGFFAHALADDLDIGPHFFGKPFANAFDDAFALLPGIPKSRMAMVGDTLHTDILGGRAAGVDTVLVEGFGLFAGEQVDPYIRQSNIIPDHRCYSIA